MAGLLSPGSAKNSAPGRARRLFFRLRGLLPPCSRALRASHLYISRMGPTWSGVRRPYTSLLIIITGARPQAPTQRQESRENFPSAVMAPGEMPASAPRRREWRPPLYVAGGAQTDRNLIFPLGIKGKLGVERGHPVHFGQGDVQPFGDKDLDLLRQVAENFLGGLKHRHGGPGLPLMCGDHLLQALFLLRRAPVGDNGLQFGMNTSSLSEMGRLVYALFTISAATAQGRCSRLCPDPSFWKVFEISDITALQADKVYHVRRGVVKKKLD